MPTGPTKDVHLAALVEELRRRLGVDAFQIVDHWPDDPLAVGIASQQDARVLAYVSVTPGADDPYFVSLELPPEGEWADHPYTPGAERDACEIDELVEILSAHLRRALPIE